MRRLLKQIICIQTKFSYFKTFHFGLSVCIMYSQRYFYPLSAKPLNGQTHSWTNELFECCVWPFCGVSTCRLRNCFLTNKNAGENIWRALFTLCPWNCNHKLFYNSCKVSIWTKLFTLLQPFFLPYVLILSTLRSHLLSTDTAILKKSWKSTYPISVAWV